MVSPLFRRGIPTEPDVVALMTRFGVPEEGTPITYAEVADVLHLNVASSRFRTVTMAWRRQLESDHRVVLTARDGAFTVRDPESRISFSKSMTKAGYRRLGRANRVATDTDAERLSEAGRVNRDKVMQITSKAQLAIDAEARKRPAPRLRAVGESKRDVG